jgi:hypothetical protein
MNEDNGLWIREQNQIVDFVSDFLQNWLEDNINEELYSNMEKTSEKYSNTELFETQTVGLFTDYLSVREKSFSEQLNKLETTN